jgi:hypothetical protein
MVFGNFPWQIITFYLTCLWTIKWILITQASLPKGRNEPNVEITLLQKKRILSGLIIGLPFSPHTCSHTKLAIVFTFQDSTIISLCNSQIYEACLLFPLILSLHFNFLIYPHNVLLIWIMNKLKEHSSLFSIKLAIYLW